MKSVLILICCFVFYNNALEFPEHKSDLFPSIENCGHREHWYGFPWLVFISRENHGDYPAKYLRCVGSLISKRYVLTHKSCLVDIVNDEVYVGQENALTNMTADETPSVKIGIEKKITNDAWDVALIRLDGDIELRVGVQPICLPFDKFKKAEPGVEVVTSGWGPIAYYAPYSPGAKFLRSLIVEKEKCVEFEKISADSDEKCTCLVKKRDSDSLTACHGDEGSPIMTVEDETGHWVLHGVLSDVSDEELKPCALHKPAVGCTVTEEILQWIIDQVVA